MRQKTSQDEGGAGLPAEGVAGWLLQRLHGGRRSPPRLEVIERVALAPRHSLALVEAEGQRLLVATSPEGPPAFYALDARAEQSVTAPAERFPPLSVRPAKNNKALPTAVRASW
jgi:flagellar biogenesis protein FliO